MAESGAVDGKCQIKSCLTSVHGSKLSYKQKKALIKKEKRKLKRQELAKQRNEEQAKEEERRKNSPTYCAMLAREVEEEEAERLRLEDESRRQRELWLWSEEVFAQKLKQKQEQEERERQLRIETEKKIKEEWEERQRKEKEAEEERKKKKEKQVTASRWTRIIHCELYSRDKGGSVGDELLRKAREGENKDGAWHNPLAPVQYGKERQIETCPFFTKVGACRFGERCSRAHPYPETGRTLLFGGMFKHFQLDQGLCEEYDMDIVLEYEDNEVYQKFREFYEDTLPEFKAVGKITQFKVCCNYQPHLRGNVYVAYTSEADAMKAFTTFNARWYGGKQMTAQLVDVSSWKRAICGLFGKGKCPKGRECNFLHVFRNPTNEFSLADRDIEQFSSSHHRDRHSNTPRHYSSRSFDRHRRHSRSPSRSSRRNERSRSRSRERHSSRRSKRSRSPDVNHRSRRSKRRSRSRSKYSNSRSRSRERSSKYRKTRSRSHSKDRSSRYRLKSRSRSKERSSKHQRSRSRSHSKERSSCYRSKSRSRSKERSSRKKHRSKKCRSRSKDRSDKTGKEAVVTMDTMNNYDESLYETEWVEKTVQTDSKDQKQS